MKFYAVLSVAAGLSRSFVVADLPSCQIYSNNQCQGDAIVTDPSFEANRWFTPPRGSADWEEGFQDHSHLVGFATVVYDKGMDSATVSVTATHKSNATITYSFDGGKGQDSNEAKYTSSTAKGPIQLTVMGSDGTSIDLEPLDFAWNAPKVSPSHSSGDYREGQKGAIVEMFGWPHADVEKECEFLAKSGYMGVKVFPPQEQIMSTEPFQNVMNPWYFMYQPVSYKLDGRMGTRDELRSMIQTCRSLGVRVYADAVVNHMTGGGNDANPKHRNPDANCQEFGAKQSTANSPMYTQNYVYSESDITGLPPLQEFPAAAYGPQDFHCERVLNSWTDPLDLNAGWLTGLTDLNTERDYVQERIAAYLTDLIGIGFSGFRMDAAKHIQPDDLVAIFGKLKRNLGGSLPSDFITWLEILLGGEKDLLMCDPDSGYNYGSYLEDALLDSGFDQDDVDKIKIWNSGYPKEPDAGACTIKKKRNAIQNDDADQQNPGSTSRDMGDQGCVLIKDCEGKDQHKEFEVKLFSSPNGIEDEDEDYPIRLILSSFYFADGIQGIPDGKSDCDLCETECDTCTGVGLTAAYDDQSTGYDEVYTRPHRDADIIAAMQDWMGI